MGGGSSPAKTGTVQTLPSEAKPFYKDIMNRASRASMKPFSAYKGKRLAKYNPDELRFQGGIRGLYDQGLGRSGLEGREGHMGIVEAGLCSRRSAERGEPKHRRSVEALTCAPWTFFGLL